MSVLTASALFCETVRSEQSGQDTLIGVFPDNINTNIPGIMTGLAVYARISFEPVGPTLPMSIMITFTNGETVTNDIEPSVVQKAQQDAELSGHPLATVISRMQFLNLPVNATGRMTVTAQINKKTYTLAALNFREIPK
jgi:hypothetical protein